MKMAMESTFSFTSRKGYRTRLLMPCLTVFGKRSRISPAIDSRSLSPDCLRRNRVRTDCPWWGVSTISHRRLSDTARYSRKRVFIAPRPQVDGSWRTLRPAHEMDLLSDWVISFSRINRFGGRGLPLCDRRWDGGFWHCGDWIEANF